MGLGTKYTFIKHFYVCAQTPRGIPSWFVRPIFEQNCNPAQNPKMSPPCPKNVASLQTHSLVEQHSPLRRKIHGDLNIHDTLADLSATHHFARHTSRLASIMPHLFCPFTLLAPGSRAIVLFFSCLVSFSRTLRPFFSSSLWFVSYSLFPRSPLLLVRRFCVWIVTSLDSDW